MVFAGIGLGGERKHLPWHLGIFSCLLENQFTLDCVCLARRVVSMILMQDESCVPECYCVWLLIAVQFICVNKGQRYARKLWTGLLPRGQH
jgi:hypothetical protein